MSYKNYFFYLSIKLSYITQMPIHANPHANHGRFPIFTLKTICCTQFYKINKISRNFNIPICQLQHSSVLICNAHYFIFSSWFRTAYFNFVFDNKRSMSFLDFEISFLFPGSFSSNPEYLFYSN